MAIATTVALDGPVIVGAGLAGLMTALELDAPCLVLSAGALGEGTSTGWAQGGVAAAVGTGDSPALHARDTLAAGAGLCEPDAVAPITAAGRAAIERMARVGARFDRGTHGELTLGLEGAHSRHRIVHAHGDATGAELLRACLAAARASDTVTLWEHARAIEVLVEDGRVAGVRVELPEGPVIVRTPHVVLATGGVGGLFEHTTNPLGSRGQGLALAARAGALLRDVEMVQFHPTALDVGLDPMPLVSEAVRGEGALLVDAAGVPIVDDPLAARDVVARTAWAALGAGRRVFLDARTHPGAGFRERFPGISDSLDAAALDPRTDLIPVRPAAHYHMGGVLVDGHGRSTVPGLYAVGEVSSTGLHGANRLASNSLLEAIVCARWVAADLRARGGETRGVRTVGAQWVADAAGPDPDAIPAVRGIVSRRLGVVRDRPGLEAALTELAPYADTDEGLVATLMARAALTREESRGAHARSDFTGTDPGARHTLVDLSDALAPVAALAAAS